MQTKNCSVGVIGLLLVGFLTLPLGMVYAQGPVIAIVSPTGEPRYVRTSDPIDPAITVDVAVEFPIVETACVGPNPPVDPGTLEVYVWRVIDAVMQQEWTVDTSSGWTWTGTDRVEGQVTIGGVGSGQNRSRYCIRVCIENSVERKCNLGGFLRVEIPVTEFVAGYYDNSRILSLVQDPPECILSNTLVGLVDSLYFRNPAYFFVVSVPATGGTTVSFYNIPLFGWFDFTASWGTPPDNDITLLPVTLNGIDLGAYKLPLQGYNCLLSGSADGVVYGEVSPGQDVDGQLRVFDISAGEGSGTGSCSLDPLPGCEIYLNFDGDL